MRIFGLMSPLQNQGISFLHPMHNPAVKSLVPGAYTVYFLPRRRADPLHIFVKRIKYLLQKTPLQSNENVVPCSYLEKHHRTLMYTFGICPNCRQASSRG